MRLINIENLNLEFPNKVLFKNASLTVCEGDHIGLIGVNGCGKSTLVKIILGEVVPDDWAYDRNGKANIGFLDQYADIKSLGTVYEYIQTAFDELHKINNELNAIYDSIDGLESLEQMKQLEKAEKLSETLNENDYYMIDKRIDDVLCGLGFDLSIKSSIINELSGGQKTKLILGKLLLQKNDLLLLDEPTNFLDSKYIKWLGDYLCRSSAAFIVVSHDKAFLNKISTTIAEISNRKINIYRGNYDFYLIDKEKRDEVQLQQMKAQEKWIANAEKYVSENSEEAMGGIVRTKATWLKKMLKTMERIEKPDEIIKPQFAFKYKKGETGLIIKLTTAEIGYSKTPILPPISLEVRKGEKIIFRGYNGAGKTTLLKSIAFDLPLVSGEIEFGDGVSSVFLKQEEDYENNFSAFSKHERKLLGIKKGKQQQITAMEFIKQYFPETPNKELQKAMLSCGLTAAQLYNRVRNLSGGEMTKLRLCIAMMNEVNLIILDEPTNHLDVYSKDVLMHALEVFSGTVLMTTHDTNIDISWATKTIDM